MKIIEIIIENHSIQSLEDRSSHSINSAGTLSTFQMIIQLLNKIYTSSYDLYYAAYEAYVYADNAYTDFDDITFSQSYYENKINNGKLKFYSIPSCVSIKNVMIFNDIFKVLNDYYFQD